MSSKSRIKFARRREGVTDYKQRFGMLKAGKPRLIVRQTNTKIIAQMATFKDAGDYTITSALSSDLAALGWKHSIKSIPAAYLTGMLIASKAKGKNVSECIMDVGLKTLTKGSRIFAVLKGAVDGGLAIPHSEENLPSAERIKGKHISDYRKKDISGDFEEMKKKIAGGAIPEKKKKTAPKAAKKS